MRRLHFESCNNTSLPPRPLHSSKTFTRLAVLEGCRGGEFVREKTCQGSQEISRDLKRSQEIHMQKNGWPHVMYHFNSIYPLLTSVKGLTVQNGAAKAEKHLDLRALGAALSACATGRSTQTNGASFQTTYGTDECKSISKYTVYCTFPFHFGELMDVNLLGFFVVSWCYLNSVFPCADPFGWNFRCWMEGSSAAVEFRI